MVTYAASYSMMALATPTHCSMKAGSQGSAAASPANATAEIHRHRRVSGADRTPTKDVQR